MIGWLEILDIILFKVCEQCQHNFHSAMYTVYTMENNVSEVTAKLLYWVIDPSNPEFLTLYVYLYV